MSVCVAADEYSSDIGGQFGYGNHSSYTGEILDGHDAQGAHAHGNWPTPSPGHGSALPPYWQDGSEEWSNGEYGNPEWPSGPWGPPTGQGGCCPDWRQSRGVVGHGGRPKRRFCTSFPEVSQCRRGSTCAFAHSREEISAQLLDESEENQDPAALTDSFFMYKYKTRWCPIGVQHEWHTCVYAHNYQDARRPVDIGYGARLCPYWSKKDTGAEYSQRCPLGLRCPYSHGAKEQLYHPHYFKTVICRDVRAKACPRQLLCAFFHNRHERRVPPSDSVDYSQPLPSEALPADWVEEFLVPPFLPPEGNKNGCGGCGGGGLVEDRGEWYGDNVGPVSNCEAEVGANGNMVAYSQQMPNGAQGNYGPQMFHGPAGPNGPCVILLPMTGMMPPGSPGGNNVQHCELPPSPPQGAMPMPPNWVFVPMDGSHGQPPSY